MPADDLRTKLKALVEEWRGQVTKSDRAFGYRLLAAASIKECADQLAALLAESEPEPCAEWRHCEHDGEDGHIACDVLCADCGMHRDAHPDCEAKAKLPPIGHEFVEWTEPMMSGEVRAMGSSRCKLCGRKRDAHLPLGHEFWGHMAGDERACSLYMLCHFVGEPGGLCGQPRSAHEVRR